MQQSKRETWKNKKDFVISLISYGVGLGNVWRFPFLAYSSGGGAFLVPYLISSIIVGIPYAILEVSLGQLRNSSGIGAWNLTPKFKGIGYANIIIAFLGNIYYQIILAWSLRYFYDSLSIDLTWKYCNNKWNSQCCNEKILFGASNGTISNSINKTSSQIFTKNTSIIAKCSKYQDPISEYWNLNILAISKGIEDVGNVKWDLFAALLISWIIVYLSIFRGIKNSTIIVYITAIMPYVFLFILLFRALFLPGAIDGILFYLKPDWEKLTRFQVWSDAGTQVFYSYGIGISALVSLGSYNKFHHNSYRDVFLFSMINTLTSILSGFVVFAVLGYMSFMQNVAIQDVAEEGPGLAFIVYPQALALLPFSSIWSLMFFIMLFLLGLGTQLAATEAITQAIQDEYKLIIERYFGIKHSKKTITAIVIFIAFVCGIPMITKGGMYIFQIFDYYAASRSLLFVGLFECIAIAYGYGVKKYCENLEKMWLFKLGLWLKFMWAFVTPLFTLALIIFTIMTYQDLTYNRTYKYPYWALIFGWSLSVSSVICIPIYALYKYISEPVVSQKQIYIDTSNSDTSNSDTSKESNDLTLKFICDPS